LTRHVNDLRIAPRKAARTARGAGRHVHDHETPASSARSSERRSSTSRRSDPLRRRDRESDRKSSRVPTARHHRIRTCSYLRCRSIHRIVDGADADSSWRSSRRRSRTFPDAVL
jgi:hypothetical protein